MGREDLLRVHQELLERWRARMNLVGPGPTAVHYEDAHAALDVLEDPPTGRWADLGTGAGFPGVVLAARWPELGVDLVDSRRKRCVFLEEVLDRAGVDGGVRVVCDRIEALEDGVYDGVTARALAPPEEVLAHAARLLTPTGRVVLFLQGHADPPDAPDFRVEAVRDYGLEGKARRAVVLRRVSTRAR